MGLRRLPASMTVSQILSAGDPPLTPGARDSRLRHEGKTARNAEFVERSEDLRRAPQFDQIAAIGFLVLYLALAKLLENRLFLPVVTIPWNSPNHRRSM